MKQFRFSPIQSKADMMKALEYIHVACHALCKQTMGKYLPYLPVAGNIGIFCHFDEEYTYLTALQKELTDLTQNVYGKYFLFREPVIFPKIGDIPETTYRYLYIRKPDPNKDHVGDLDFYLEAEKYELFKQSIIDGKEIIGARTLPHRTDFDLVELFDPTIDALAYVGSKNWNI